MVLIPVNAFAAVGELRRALMGITVTERRGLGIVSLHARKGQENALAERIRHQFDVELPQSPRREHSNGISFLGFGKSSWLATCEVNDGTFYSRLRATTEDTASLCDQSDAYAVLRLEGPHVRNSLAKLVPIDLHPRAFSVGGVAATLAAHIGTVLWRLEDTKAGDPVFEIAVYRSMAESLWHALAPST